ncbi:hypothetical protein NLI96_g10737 [Meripilus lineatus]|uniref:Uncharacterized protein n=1 Tax=Meripilus lineatus TaxID=2056292 RepID=A0AAD5UXM2_9APHY|nr:hypothetical protein NLI96_g10737 [Physisporinus lineatus]
MPKPKSQSEPRPSTSYAHGRTQLPDFSPGRRMLHRAAALLNTKGEINPAIVEELGKLDCHGATPLTTSPVIGRNLSEPGPTPFSGRKSESGALGRSLSFSGIRRGLVKVKDVSVTVVRRGSFKRQKPPSPEKSIVDPSINEAGSSTTTASSSISPPPAPSNGTKGRHKRSYSDGFWTRPNVVESL